VRPDYKLQVYVPNGAVFQQSPRERRIRECGGRREWGRITIV
jgi:hypothetical protein